MLKWINSDPLHLGIQSMHGLAACCITLDHGLEVGGVERVRNEPDDEVMCFSGWLERM